MSPSENQTFAHQLKFQINFLIVNDLGLEEAQRIACQLAISRRSSCHRFKRRINQNLNDFFSCKSGF